MSTIPELTELDSFTSLPESMDQDTNSVSNMITPTNEHYVDHPSTKCESEPIYQTQTHNITSYEEYKKYHLAMRKFVSSQLADQYINGNSNGPYIAYSPYGSFHQFQQYSQSLNTSVNLGQPEKSEPENQTEMLPKLVETEFPAQTSGKILNQSYQRQELPLSLNSTESQLSAKYQNNQTSTPKHELYQSYHIFNQITNPNSDESNQSSYIINSNLAPLPSSIPSENNTGVDVAV